MSIFTHIWRDEAKARDVELVVDYVQEENTVYIERITPVRMSFYCKTSGATKRAMRIHTATARRILVDEFQQTRDTFPTLEQSILAQQLLNSQAPQATR